MTALALIRHPEELTSAWLDLALGKQGLQLTGTERIGTGQMSQSHRVFFRTPEGASETVVVKLASDDPTSRATGVGMGAYYREIAFYRDLAERIGGRWRAATSPSTTTPRAGSRSSCRTSPAPRRATRSRAAASSRRALR